MRKFLTILLFMVMVASIAAACGGDEKTPTPEAIDVEGGLPAAAETSARTGHELDEVALAELAAGLDVFHDLLRVGRAVRDAHPHDDGLGAVALLRQRPGWNCRP